MSEQQNAALIQSLYDAFSRGDLPFILDRLTEDVAQLYAKEQTFERNDEIM